MNSQDMDRLLEEGFSGDPPGEAFRARVLRDSTAAFVGARRGRSRWRLAALASAAVFLVAASFLLGRCTARPSTPPPTTETVVADAAETVAVSSELVAWLEAANLFRQLGMEDRMARAVNRAGNLLPENLAVGDGVTPNESEEASLPEMPAPRPTSETMNRIMAQSVGD